MFRSETCLLVQHYGVNSGRRQTDHADVTRFTHQPGGGGCGQRFHLCSRTRKESFCRCTDRDINSQNVHVCLSDCADIRVFGCRRDECLCRFLNALATIGRDCELARSGQGRVVGEHLQGLFLPFDCGHVDDSADNGCQHAQSHGTGDNDVATGVQDE